MPLATRPLSGLARAESLAAPLPPLLLQAQRAAATVSAGAHGRRRAGPGETFWQFRAYQPGDAATLIDWRQSAKGDRAYVREREWAAAETLIAWVQGGPGMAWRSAPVLPTKRDRAMVLMLATAALAVRGGERVANLDPPLPATLGHAALVRLAVAGEPGETLPPGRPLPRHATALLVGDFLSPLETIAARLEALCGHGTHGHMVQVLDPAEEALPYSGRVMFTEPGASGGWLARRVEAVRPEYQERLAAHRHGLAALAAGHGWSFAVHHTDHAPEAALLALWQRLSGTVKA